MPNDGALERLSKKLDAGAADEEIERTHLSPTSPHGPTTWVEPEVKPATEIFMAKKKRLSPLELVFFGSVAFFVVAIAVAGFFFFSGANTVSTKNVDIAITGPTQIGAGNTLSLQIVITNRNAVPIQLADLVVDFPPGTRSDTDVSVGLPRIRDTLGTINPGESANRTIKAVLFGQAGTDAPIAVSVEYRVPSSNAIFVSNAAYTARISESPASIAVKADSQAVSGQSSAIAVTVTSNSASVLNSMLLSANYPPGFSFTSASPAPQKGTTIWNLGDIEPGGSRTVTIQGVFTGEDGDNRAITFTAGNETASGSGQIAAPLASGEADLTVTKPFISTDIALNGSVADSHIVRRGDTVTGEIRWTNNLPVAVQNLSLVVALKGTIVDQASVRPTQGFFNSSNASMVWDKTTYSNFANVAPGASGTLTFSFKILPASQGTFRSPEVDLTASVKADRASEGSVPGTVTATAVTKAVVATDLGLTSSLVHVSGPFPPKVNTETVYAVTWTLTNSSNALANTTVTATLPNYARFASGVSSGQNVSYNDSQGIVTWTVGNLAAGASQSASFNIGITPSVSQVGNRPVVISAQRVSGIDRFVQDTVQATAPDTDTSAAAASYQQGIVVP